MSDPDMETEQIKSRQAQLLRVVLMKSVDDILAEVDLTKWKSTLGVVSHLKNKIPNLRKAFNREMPKEFEASIKGTLTSMELHEAFRLLEELVNQQKAWKSTTAWRPSGSVEKDIIDKDVAALQSLKIQLDHMFASEQQAVSNLQEDVKNIRIKITQFENMLSDFQSTVSDKVRHQDEQQAYQLHPATLMSEKIIL